ncbi:hypothetical protein [Nostoc sp.]|uniref:hypothetical protein n=1 Tax=Nostoc sp. TaxID=1180 RepID=UPI003FA52347
MKINRHGRAKVLTQSEIQLIFSHGLDNDRDRGLCREMSSLATSLESDISREGQGTSPIIYLQKPP